FFATEFHIAAVNFQAPVVHTEIILVGCHVAPALLVRLVGIAAQPVALRRGRPVLGIVAVNLEVKDHANASLTKIENETAVRLAKERRAADGAFDRELEPWRLGALLQQREQLVVGPTQHVALKDMLTIFPGSVSALRFNLRFKNGGQLELWVGTGTEQGG